MVRNEADVIELWARYNLRVLDHLHVIDHGSQDNTADVLAQLQAEGLPISLHGWGEGAYHQAEAMRDVGRTLAAQGGVDFVVPLDADELLATSRPGLHSALLALPPGHAGAMRWRTYLPSALAPPEGEQAFFRHMTRYRSEELPAMLKVIAPAAMLLDHCWQMGNHALFRESDSQKVPVVTLPFALAHFPVRDEAQLRRKVKMGAHASRLKTRRIRNESWHWLMLDALFRERDAQQLPVDLLPIALAYSYSNQHDLVATAQQILQGGVSDAPEVVQRYVAKPLTMAEVDHWLAVSEQEHAAHLSQLGVAEFNAANRAWRSGDWTAALTAYSEAAFLAPALALAHLGRARCLMNLGQWIPAREAFAACLRLEPTNFSAWLESGHLCRKMGELKQAADAYQQAINVSSERYEAHLAMARVLHQLNHKPLASQAFEKAMALATAQAGGTGSGALPAQVAHRMGQYLLELGDNVSAIQVLSLALQALGEPADVNRLAEVRKDLDEALQRVGQHGGSVTSDDIEGNKAVRSTK
ncbi:MAG: glycosyltransferase family 2 protein [Hydrogenophaga sp.]